MDKKEFEKIVKEKIKNFWGYGNLNSDIWLVGMEEGFNGDKNILEKRIKATHNSKVFDLYEDLKIDPGNMKWFEENAPTQKTYRPLIYILLYLTTGKEPNLEEIRQYQINKFGRKNSNHAILELMPLPSKSLNEKDWLYKDITGLSSRKEYLDNYKPKRVSELKKLILDYKPKLVIFYSKTYLPDWINISGVALKEVVHRKLYIAKNHDTLYAVVPHPTSFGISGNDWKNIVINLQTLLRHQKGQVHYPKRLF